MNAKNGLVEVYDPAQRCFIPGYLVDIEKSRVQVRFELADGKSAGPPKWFEWSTVREVPTVKGPFQLTEGQAVEVSYVEEGSSDPAAWWEAKIVSKKGPYCKVHFLCGSFPDEAVEEDVVRPATTSHAAKPMYSKATIPLGDAAIHARFLQDEAAITERIREKAQLLSIIVEKSKPQLKLIGSSKSIAMAKMLVRGVACAPPHPTTHVAPSVPLATGGAPLPSRCLARALARARSLCCCCARTLRRARSALVASAGGTHPHTAATRRVELRMHACIHALAGGPAQEPLLRHGARALAP